MAADSLVARHRAMPTGGWAWRSSIQAPHYQTDRDVGAAWIGEGLLAAYAVTRRPRYMRAAVEAGDFLLGVAEPAAGGLRWPDWADPDGRRSTTHFTSFDDGAAGISDYLWRLFEVTARAPLPRRSARRACAGWSRRPEGPSCPETACSWTVDRRSRPGASPTTASAWARRASCSCSTASPTEPATRVPRLRSRRRRVAAGADRERHAPAAARLRERATLETGFLSGSAGAAYVFLERYAAIEILPISRRRAGCSLGQRPGGRGRRGTGQLAVRRPRGSLDALRASSSASPGSPGSTFRPLGRRATPATASVRAAAGVWLRHVGSPEAPGRSCRAIARPGARRARQRRRRDRLGARGPRPRRHRHGCEPRGRALGTRRACAPRLATTASGHSGTRTGPAHVDGCAPSPRGTGARPGSPPSRPGSAGWSGAGSRWAARSLTRPART